MEPFRDISDSGSQGPYAPEQALGSTTPSWTQAQGGPGRLQDPGEPLPIPLDFNVYSESATDGTTYYIGPHRNAVVCAVVDKMYSIKEQPGPFLVVHAGLDKRSTPVLGSATSNFVSAARSQWSREPNFAIRFDDYIIRVMNRGGSPDHTGLGTEEGQGQSVITERLLAVNRGSRHRPVMVMCFGMDMMMTMPTQELGDAFAETNHHDSTRQEFEWHEAESAEILKLGGRPSGWRLVAAGDASQTLAVCTRISRSLTKFFRFAFVGRGVAMAHEDHAWEVMAVLTGMTVWHRRLEIDHSRG
ncbi:uncharacterized protein B0I36DRAFT_309792 [Microdochium trichocladiopsis]|uniref:Uncharacterized protein n=1 Tax=Microdochium trichocladiopsis TaxID=1682393 RepID=A0A9P8YGL5_9PEZI|nr:uncharacterized protein B0I36DRAFT_309792 [Microdochium trichocladiopsis]KAH7040024.1 hypothetical protein B0I36DRAFT_309792 [Microdochium trichocladiopsis]